ncbi:MAG: cysteine desulfurase NifS [Rhodospirillaceae bacterium]|nr:cysteine desulfurase NifS [Rhodospirillaceae bacterium]
MKDSNLSLYGTREVYLDSNATTQPLPEVVELVASAMASGCGNPSSVHAAGERSRAVLRKAREQVASFVNAVETNVVFTGGATEANNIVLQSLASGKLSGYRLVTSVVEHSSILTTAERLSRLGVEVIILPVDRAGRVDPLAMADEIDPGKTLVSIQWANNETGVIQPIEELASTAKAAGALFHTDAVQAIGKVMVDLGQVPVDLLSLSAHKVHGPMGVGALVGPGLEHISPMTFGGSQEWAIRPGTENVPGILGLGHALEIRESRFDRVADHVRGLRNDFESQLISSGLVEEVNGGCVDRLPNTSNIHFASVDGEALILRLDQVGIRCSQSSACTNRKPEPSYVLRAMGLSEEQAFASVRFGFSELNTEEELSFALESVREIHASLQRFALA